MKFYLGGEVVHTIHGAEPDSTFRAALARFIASPEDAPHQAALRAHAGFRDDLGRRGLLALFALLGADNELTQRYRARLAQGT